ncbi:MAG: hypothetical protein IJC02_12010 [Lachnospiraceae bacterium]|nr:hypothetical protein [Lachnospiraceae bacterium]MBQ6996617.1 hypothetical protein [Lachnospiraceae bacterium]
MHKLELKNAFIDTLERERTIRGWTQWEMADKLEMSVPGYRKMVSGLTDSISLYTAYRASTVLNIPIPVLLGSHEFKDQLYDKLYHMPISTCRKVDYYLQHAEKLRMLQNVSENEGRMIDVITLSGYMKDGMDFDSAEIEQVCIPKHFSSKITRGFRITENSLLPIYAKGDILLLDEDMARSGDTAVVQNMKTRKLYVRKIILRDANSYELHPVHGRGKIIVITQEERTEWFDYGRIITVWRSNELDDKEE